MGLREFVDKRGREWKVWDVTPEGMHPNTVRELFLGEFEEGWLAFESANERRRLANWPRDWESKSSPDLEALLEQASPVAKRGSLESTTGAFRRMAESEVLLEESKSVEPESRSEAVRTFKGPSGRHWLAAPVDVSDSRGTRKVLRFTSTDGVVLDLDEWPEDWASYTPEQLIVLHGRAQSTRAERPDASIWRTDERPS